MMEMAKVTSKGQITIPISIRRRLGINEGDKILFINKQDGVLMVNPDTVQGEIADYTADAVSIDTPVTPPKPAAAAAPSSPSSPIIPMDTQQPDATAAEPPKRKYIPPVEEDLEEKAPVKAGGIDLNTLLDDLRNIGSV